MKPVLVDSNVLLDVVTDSPDWAELSRTARRLGWRQRLKLYRVAAVELVMTPEQPQLEGLQELAARAVSPELIYTLYRVAARSPVVGWVPGERTVASGPAALATLTAAGLVALLAVKTFAFRLPAFVERHPYDEIAVLRELEERDRDPGLVLAGTSPFLGRYLDRPYLALPDAFGEELEHPQRGFDRVRPELERAGVRFVVVGAGDLRDRPRSLLGDTPPVDWLEPVDGPEPVARAREEEVAVWKVSL